MTPFAEEVLEAAPDMVRFFQAAQVFDLNSDTQSIFDCVNAFMKEGKGFINADLNPGRGSYWFECSGFADLRWRVGFACGVEGQELIATAIFRTPTGEIIQPTGTLWVLFSDLSPLTRVLDIHGLGTNLDPTYGILLAACVREAMGR